MRSSASMSPNSAHAARSRCRRFAVPGMRTSKIATVLSSLSGKILCGANFMLERSFLRVVAVGTGHTGGIFFTAVQEESVYVRECGKFRFWAGVLSRNVLDARASHHAPPRLYDKVWLDAITRVLQPLDIPVQTLRAVRQEKSALVGPKRP